MSLEKAGKTILVTGASRGIGRAICQQLLTGNHAVVGLARDFTKYGDIPVNLHCHTIDFADLTALPNHLRAIVKQYPSLDAVVCNAGYGQFGSLEEFSYPQISELMNVNFISQAYVVKAVLPLFKRRKQGDIILMGSDSALWGGRRGAVYSASKAALRGFAQALRDECARSGVRVMLINPGMVRTEFFQQQSFAPGDADENAIYPEEIAELVQTVLCTRTGMVIDEINLSPLKKVLKFKP